MRLAPIALLTLAMACRFPHADQHFGLDVDGDGIGVDDDCDDNDDTVFPGADERCNGTDDDCDEDVDEDAIDSLTFHVDADDDGVGLETGATATGCTAPSGFAEETGDCDDGDDGRFPGNTEIPDDDIDQDCNGDDAVTCFADGDHDGWGATTTVVAPDGSCDTADGEAQNDDDCADGDATRFPGAVEIVGDTIDQNCDGFDTPPCYEDDDDDGFGDPLAPIQAADCATAGGVSTGTDCKDNYGTVHPGATEACDGFPSDCDDWAAAGNPGTRPANEVDDDDDGYVECTFASGINAGNWGNTETPAIVGGGDCADDYPTVNPNPGTEACDGFPSDCDTWSGGNPGTRPAAEVDNDNDGYVECTLASGITPEPDGNWGNDETPDVIGGGDCDDDAAPATHPGATEICDGVVNSCSGNLPADEVDNDSDTYVECTLDSGGWQGGGGVVGGGDCDDVVPETHPGATEICDGADNDCDVDHSIADEDGKATLQLTAGGWQAQTFLSNARTNLTISSNGTLWFCKGVFYTRVTVTAASLTIAGRYGAALTTLSGADPVSGDPAARTIDISDPGAGTRDVVVEDLTLEEATGLTGDGGAIRTAGAPSVTVTDCVIKDNFARNGGGIYMSGGTLDVGGTEFLRNEADLGESGADGSGGGIEMVNGTLTIDDSSFTDNDGRWGAGLDVITGLVTVTGTTTFTTNVAEVSGGAGYIANGDVTFDSTTFTQNSAADGGGLFVEAGTVDLPSSTFTQNSCTNDGGALFGDAGTITGTTTTFSTNSAAFGGAIFVDGATVTLTSSSLSANTATTRGGAIRVLSGTLSLLSNTVVSGNTSSGTADVDSAKGGGGGLAFRTGTVTITDSDITGNHATAGHGGGVLIDVGGGQSPVLNVSGGSLIGTNDALTSGGGIAQIGSSTVNIDNSFITGNTADQGAGVMLNSATATFDCDSSPVDQGGVTGNVADGSTGTNVDLGGGIQVNVNGAWASSNGCFFGTSGVAGTNNTPDDVGYNNGSQNFGNNTVFCCVFNGCTTSSSTCP